MSNPYQQYDEQYGARFGVNSGVLSQIGMLESGNRPGVMNNWDSNARAGIPSGGRMQFIEPTYTSFLGQAQKAAPGVFGQWSKKDWMDPEAQTALTAWAIRNGKGSHWATFDRAKSAAGGPVYTKKDWSAAGSGSGGSHAKHGTGQTVNPGHYKGGADPKKLKSIQSAWRKHPEMAAAKMRRHVRDNKREWVPGTVSGSPVKLAGPSYDAPKGLSGFRLGQHLGSSLFGLQNDPGDHQTTGGGHSANSWHYKGNAVDYGNARNSREQLNRWYDFLDQNRKKYGVLELLKEGWGTSNEHVHAAFK